MAVPVFVPVRVSVRAPDPPNAIAPVPVKARPLAADAAEESMVAVRPLASPMVKRRSVLATLAALCRKVPPPKTRFPAVAAEAPMLLLLPPAANVAASKMPASILVRPV